MRSSRLQKLIWIGPISGNVCLEVINDLAKFHAFVIKLNYSVLFWSITAGLTQQHISKTTKRETHKFTMKTVWRNAVKKVEIRVKIPFQNDKGKF